MERKPTVPVLDLIVQRWSPRAMADEPLTDLQIQQLVEAARWAPSSYNNQPWRFFYALRDDEFWQEYLNLLVPFNQAWASRAGVLFIAVAKKTFDYNGKPSRTACYDTGAAAVSLALQGFSMGLVVHQMEGFDYDRAAELLKLPADHEVMAMIAAGLPGDASQLSVELQEREKPSLRRPVEEILFHGTLRKD